MDRIFLYRNATLVAELHPDGNAVQTKQIMGDNVVTMNCTTTAFVDIRYGDTADVFGERYKVNTLPTPTKLSGSWTYGLTLHADYFDLSKVQFNALDANNELTKTQFNLRETLDGFVRLLLENANRVFPFWYKGDVIQTGYKDLSFNGEKCLDVLNRLASEFDTEWWVEGKTIHLSRRRNPTNMFFQVGWNQGLYSISRSGLTDTKIVTRLYAEGSDQNLPPTYRNYSQRLKMLGGVPYLEQNVALYGVSEDAKIFDGTNGLPNIYPHRTGKVTAVADNNTFYDSDLTIDINQNLIPGVEPKVTFNSGDLQGYTFKLSSYNATTKEFKILQNTEETTLQVPSDAFHPRVGDQYVPTDIMMPAYIDEAERQLTIAAQTWLVKNSRPQYSYSVNISPTYVVGKDYEISIGDTVRIVDSELGIDESITVSKTTRNLIQEGKYTVELSERKVDGPVTQLRTQVAETGRTAQRALRQVGSLPIQNNWVRGTLNIDGTLNFSNLLQFPDNATARAALRPGSMYYRLGFGLDIVI